MSRDGLVDRLLGAARAAVFDLVLLAGADAPAATRIFTRSFLARFLLDVTVSCATLGGSCSCTLGADCAFLVAARVCLAIPLSASKLLVAYWFEGPSSFASAVA